MFWNNNESTQLKADIDRLEKDKRNLKNELEDLKLKKKMEEEDIKHMVKINNERKDIELEKEKLLLQSEQAEAIAVVKDEYRDKTEAQLEKQLDNMKGMHGEILARLPNYNIKHSIKESK